MSAHALRAVTGFSRDASRTSAILWRWRSRRQRFPGRIRHVGRREHGWVGLVTTVVLAVAATAVFTGCGTVSGSLKADAALTGALPTPDSTVPTAAVSDDASAVTTEATPRPAVDTEQQ